MQDHCSYSKEPGEWLVSALFSHSLYSRRNEVREPAYTGWALSIPANGARDFVAGTLCPWPCRDEVVKLERAGKTSILTVAEMVWPGPIPVNACECGLDILLMILVSGSNIYPAFKLEIVLPYCRLLRGILRDHTDPCY